MPRNSKRISQPGTWTDLHDKYPQAY
jgi:hypothetical protein